MHTQYLDSCLMSTVHQTTLRDPDTQATVIRITAGTGIIASNLKSVLCLFTTDGVTNIFRVYISKDDRIPSSIDLVLTYLLNRLGVESGIYMRLRDYGNAIVTHCVHSKIHFYLGTTKLGSIRYPATDASQLVCSPGMDAIAPLLVTDENLSELELKISTRNALAKLASMHNLLGKNDDYCDQLQRFYISNCITPAPNYWDTLLLLSPELVHGLLRHLRGTQPDFTEADKPIVTINLSSPVGVFIQHGVGLKDSADLGLLKLYQSTVLRHREVERIRIVLPNNCKIVTENYLTGLLHDIVMYMHSTVNIHQMFDIRGWELPDHILTGAINSLLSVKYT